MTKTIGMVLFPDVEELDFVGPYEAFGMLAKHMDQEWQVALVAERPEPVLCAKGLRVLPDRTFEDCPPLDIVLVPGGFGTRREMENERLLAFVRGAGASSQWVTSVCTGAFILSRAGFLSGRRATTHWASLNDLRNEAGVTVVEERFVIDGNVITAAGVSAGIDMALYLIGQVKDPQTARNVQKAMEYFPEPPYAEATAAAAQKGAS
jgi:transcriptional regulator GlxA family with amidase domain